MNTTDFLNIAVAICPERDFMVFEQERLSYLQANDRINKLANALMGMGVSQENRIGMLSVNCPQYIEAYFAAAKIGGIFVPLNFRARADELTYMINASEIKVLFVGERYLDMVQEMLPNLPKLEKVISIDRPFEDMLTYEDLIASGSDEEVFLELDDDDTTILMFTSGTTGRPKAVPMTHTTFTMYILDNVDPADPENEEKNLLTVPMYHVAGIQGMLAAVYGGRTLVLMRQFEVKEWLEAVQNEGANRAMLVPTMLKQIIDFPAFSDYDLSNLQVITYGAAAMPFEVIKKAIDVFPGASFINAFGQTETGSTITILSPEDHVIEGSEKEQKKKLRRLSSSIGKALPDVEIRIIDENGNPVGPNEVGEIVAQGPRIMSGYWQDEEKTAQAFTPDGWLRTSDMGWMDEDGYIYLSGRADDMIIRGGENISPKEVEQVLFSHPKIEEAAVIGVPDEEWGQKPRAIVVLTEGETVTKEEIIEFCRSRLASFKRPRSVIFVDSLPRSALGKLSRKQLVEEYGGPLP
ncbi:MAG: long-chain-fatty-acid--CoA ligase [Deltaproteobacteria bacterium]|nr:long-chain-fatty-acid--CoA ligase [Deltaproteobacteria bacterium]MBW2053043.1 long-chain-fatty-acid--CoA ligase [Deltaproteobacteria bacterium]MBW2141262.1 long-chain-fatty-acid--CoA ligase [Deltaproteobacteria bacterium]MBW2322832.1 long-chain-fatty-acid--CoA ligase [Deltaproteobacteria bacterium]